MFKLLKYFGWIAIGMMFAPKKGVELRSDLVDYLKKYRPQIKKFISSIEEAWEASQGNESDEVVANIELKLNQIKTAGEELDGAKTKELAYKALQRIGQATVNLGRAASKSNNVKSIAKDLAVITVGAIDHASGIYSKVKDVSASLSENVYESGDSEKQLIEEVETITIKNTLKNEVKPEIKEKNDKKDK